MLRLLIWTFDNLHFSWRHFCWLWISTRVINRNSNYSIGLIMYWRPHSMRISKNDVHAINLLYQICLSSLGTFYTRVRRCKLMRSSFTRSNFKVEIYWPTSLVWFKFWTIYRWNILHDLLFTRLRYCSYIITSLYSFIRLFLFFIHYKFQKTKLFFKNPL